MPASLPYVKSAPLPRLTKFLTSASFFVLLFSIGFFSAPTPVQAEPNYDSGLKYYKDGDFKSAAESFSKVENADRQPRVIYYQALCNQQMGNSMGALRLYKKVNTDFPSSAEARLAQQYLRQMGQPTNAQGYGASQMAVSGGRQQSVSSYSSHDRLPESCGVPFHRGPGNHMLLNAVVGGRTMEVMFDTGAASSYFGKNQLETAGCKFYPTGQKMQSHGVGGAVDVEICMCEVRLNDIVRTVPLMVASSNSMTPLLGQTFFNPFRFDIDTAAGIIHFYNKKGGGANEGFDTLNVPFVPIGNELEVPISINGSRGKAYFDTGAGCTMFSMLQLARMGIAVPTDHPMMVSGVGGGGIAYRFHVDRLDVGPVQKTNMDLVASPSCSFSLIGQDFFKDKRFTIDNEARVIKFVH